jgi:hypothetical protein
MYNESALNPIFILIFVPFIDTGTPQAAILSNLIQKPSVKEDVSVNAQGIFSLGT